MGALMVLTGFGGMLITISLVVFRYDCVGKG